MMQAAERLRAMLLAADTNGDGTIAIEELENQSDSSPVLDHQAAAV